MIQNKVIMITEFLCFQTIIKNNSLILATIIEYVNQNFINIKTIYTHNGTKK